MLWVPVPAVALVLAACCPGVPVSTGTITTRPRRFVLGTSFVPLPEEGDLAVGVLPFCGCRRCRVTGGESPPVGSVGFLPLFLGGAGSLTEEGGSAVVSACSLAMRLEGRPLPRRAGVTASSRASAEGTSAIVSSAVPLDTLRERRANRTGFAASVVWGDSLGSEWCLGRVDTPVSTSSSANASSTSVMVSKPAPEVAVDFRRVPVDFVGVSTRFLEVAPVPRRAGVADGSCLTSEEGTALLAVFLVGLTAFLGGLLTALGTGVRFPGVCTVCVGGLRTVDIFRPVPFAAERILVLWARFSSLGLGVAVFALD